MAGTLKTREQSSGSPPCRTEAAARGGVGHAALPEGHAGEDQGGLTVRTRGSGCRTRKPRAWAGKGSLREHRRGGQRKQGHKLHGTLAPTRRCMHIAMSGWPGGGERGTMQASDASPSGLHVFSLFLGSYSTVAFKASSPSPASSSLRVGTVRAKHDSLGKKNPQAA